MNITVRADYSHIRYKQNLSAQTNYIQNFRHKYSQQCAHRILSEYSCPQHTCCSKSSLSTMYNIRTVILGSTPIRTTSRTLAARRQLFATPTPSADEQITRTPERDVSATQIDTISISTRAGTMVIHVEDSSTDRSTKTGVILRATAGPSPSTLDILWNADGSITNVLPAKLRPLPVQQFSPAPAGAGRSNISVTSTTHQPAAPPENSSSSRGFKPLLPAKLPKELRQCCPLDSISMSEIEIYQIRMDNFLSQGHPRIRQLLTGDLNSPLLSYAPYIDYMQSSCAPDDFSFDHAAADQHIQMMRDKGNHDLASTCEKMLDNPPHYDGFRPCNSAVFFAMVSSLKPEDMYVIRDIIHGDGIRLRNKIWNSMTGDAGKSKKLMAMNMSKKVSDVKYKFVRHGVAKYFTEIAKTLNKLKSLGVEKQDWEVFSTIFHHMSMQCEEYRAVVSDLRDQLEKDEDSVTLKSIEKAFARKETVHRIGITSKGTPIKAQIPLSQPPVINAAAAKPAPQKPPSNPQQQATSKSKLWPEMTAEANYGPRGSHSKGQCKYYGHRFHDNHCWQGCAKCGGCKEYHKRRRLMDEGKQLCTVHKFATHLEKNCYRHKHQTRGRNRGRGQPRKHEFNNDRRSRNHRNDRDTPRYHAKSARKRNRSRSRSRSPARSRSRSRSRHSKRYRSRSPHRSVSANYTAPKYLRNMQSFARSGRAHDHTRHDSSYPWSSGASRSQSAHRHDSGASISAHSAASSQYSSASAMQSQHARRRNMGHVPIYYDGTQNEFTDLIMRRNAKRYKPHFLHRDNSRRVVASAAQHRSQSRGRTTLIDSGAGLTVVDQSINQIHP